LRLQRRTTIPQTYIIIPQIYIMVPQHRTFIPQLYAIVLQLSFPVTFGFFGDFFAADDLEINYLTPLF
jgi:hypothetical protein